jgi:hypothetical protein
MSSESGLDTGRLARTLTLIVFVTAVFILLAAQQLDGVLFQVGVFGIGTVGAITAIIGFLIAAGSAFDDPAM